MAETIDNNEFIKDETYSDEYEPGIDYHNLTDFENTADKVSVHITNDIFLARLINYYYKIDSTLYHERTILDQFVHGCVYINTDQSRIFILLEGIGKGTIKGQSLFIVKSDGTLEISYKHIDIENFNPISIETAENVVKILENIDIGSFNFKENINPIVLYTTTFFYNFIIDKPNIDKDHFITILQDQLYVAKKYPINESTTSIIYTRVAFLSNITHALKNDDDNKLNSDTLEIFKGRIGRQDFDRIELNEYLHKRTIRFPILSELSNFVGFLPDPFAKEKYYNHPLTNDLIHQRFIFNCCNFVQDAITLAVYYKDSYFVIILVMDESSGLYKRYLGKIKTIKSNGLFVIQSMANPLKYYQCYDGELVKTIKDFYIEDYGDLYINKKVILNKNIYLTSRLYHKNILTSSSRSFLGFMSKDGDDVNSNLIIGYTTPDYIYYLVYFIEITDIPRISYKETIKIDIASKSKIKFENARRTNNIIDILFGMRQRIPYPVIPGGISKEYEIQEKADEEKRKLQKVKDEADKLLKIEEDKKAEEERKEKERKAEEEEIRLKLEEAKAKDEQLKKELEEGRLREAEKTLELENEAKRIEEEKREEERKLRELEENQKKMIAAYDKIREEENKEKEELERITEDLRKLDEALEIAKTEVIKSTEQENLIDKKLVEEKAKEGDNSTAIIELENAKKVEIKKIEDSKIKQKEIDNEAKIITTKTSSIENNIELLHKKKEEIDDQKSENDIKMSETEDKIIKIEQEKAENEEKKLVSAGKIKYIEIKKQYVAETEEIIDESNETMFKIGQKEDEIKQLKKGREQLKEEGELLMKNTEERDKTIALQVSAYRNLGEKNKNLGSLIQQNKVKINQYDEDIETIKSKLKTDPQNASLKNEIVQIEQKIDQLLTITKKNDDMIINNQKEMEKIDENISNLKLENQKDYENHYNIESEIQKIHKIIEKESIEIEGLENKAKTDIKKIETIETMIIKLDKPKTKQESVVKHKVVDFYYTPSNVLLEPYGRKMSYITVNGTTYTKIIRVLGTSQQYQDGSIENTWSINFDNENYDIQYFDETLKPTNSYFTYPGEYKITWNIYNSYIEPENRLIQIPFIIESENINNTITIDGTNEIHYELRNVTNNVFVFKSLILIQKS